MSHVRSHILIAKPDNLSKFLKTGVRGLKIDVLIIGHAIALSALARARTRPMPCHLKTKRSACMILASMLYSRTILLRPCASGQNGSRIDPGHLWLIETRRRITINRKNKVSQLRPPIPDRDSSSLVTGGGGLSTGGSSLNQR
jgi:hypothetical protein